MKKPDPFSLALRLLTARERSEKELVERLQRKGFDESTCRETAARCRSLGYLDDARFARLRARQLVESGRAVGKRVLLDLQQHGIDETLAREALTELEQERDQDTVLTDLLRRRFPGFDYDRADDRERRRVIQYFLRRGFDLAVILDRIRGRVLD